KRYSRRSSAHGADGSRQLPNICITHCSKFEYSTSGVGQNATYAYVQATSAFTCPTRKFHPEWIRIIGQNQYIVENDACDSEFARNVGRRPVRPRIMYSRRSAMARTALSFPKIPSELNWHDEVESLHRQWRCLRSFMHSGRSLPTCSSRGVDLKPRTSFSVIS